MGLDQYLYAELVLNAKNAKHKAIIEYLESLDFLNIHNRYAIQNGFFLSQYDEKEKVIRETLNSFKLFGKVGEITEIKHNLNGNWILRSEVMYWRKDNHIHAWFNTVCQAGIDNCCYDPVSYGHIEKFISTANTILNNNGLASKLMPTQGGFFFGSLGYGEYYFEALKITNRVFKKLLKPSTMNHWKLYYHASW